ncbi:SMP-30/gluconolactonase/LRE family protein [Paenibacillus silvisoli]|uniref:SMP-30/gluconolactonase/LRE family protein n=1 Tax=Paenibacillus silvisoli TaxID=3110539 RepID=UPI002805F2D6|nr:SMP-30/gluconolactonase/LRE family protein [Paenibacillus silvisoli]
MRGQLQLIDDAKATLGEGPCWDRVNGVLYWVDIIEKKVHVYNPLLNSKRVIQLEQCPGTIVPRKSGGVVLAMDRAFYALDLMTERLTLLAGIPNEPAENRFNDGKCDAAGRFWAGTTPLADIEPTGSLYCLEADLNVRHAFGGVVCSNGIAWSPDDKTMYYIDSLTREVEAFDYNAASGEIDGRRTVIKLPEGEGLPDGMTIDSEGMLWVAQWDGYKVSRWNPQNGERLEIIPVPAARVTSCTFGGEKLDELYITTARNGLSDQALAEQPLAGGLFKIKTHVSGAANHPFVG